MSLDLFRITQGLDIEDDAFTPGSSSHAFVLQGTGAPGNDGDVQDDAPIGSLFMRTDAETDNLQLYYKWQDTNSTADWRLFTSKEYVDALVSAGIHWREAAAVVVTDAYATEAAALAAINGAGGVVDGYTLQVGDRVILADIAAGGNNIKVVSAAGTVAWADDASHTLHEGDAALVTDGTSNGETQWVYDADGTPTGGIADGGIWVKMASATGSLELGFIRDYIGKAAVGGTAPTYSSSNVLTNAPSQNLTAALSSLDNAIGDGEITNDQTDNGGTSYLITDDADWAVSGSLTLTDILNNINDGVGDRTYTEENIVNSGEAIATSIDELDKAFGTGSFTNSGGNFAVTDDGTWNGGTLDATEILDNLNEAIGDRSYTSDNVLTDGETIASSLDKLDSTYGSGTITNQGGDYPLSDDLVWDTANGGTLTLGDALNSINDAVGNLNSQTASMSGTGVTLSNTVVDSIPIGEATEAKWMVQIRQSGTASARRAFEIHGMHNGTAADHNIFSRLRVGGGVPGVSFDVDVSGGNFRLLTTATGSVDYVVKRMSYSAF